MTLVELTVALVVGGAALAAGGAAFATLADRRAALLAEAQVEERALAARRALTDWLSEARPGPDGALRLTNAVIRTAAGSVDDDTLSFVTSADGAWQHVRIYVSRDETRSALVADVSGASTRRIVLAPQVSGFAVSVLSSAFGQREWRRRWSGGALRPEAVRVRLQPADGATLPAALRDGITVPLGGTP